ncbi:hypothetical protein ABZW51_32925, partial [Streptomyces cellulosae]
MTITYEWRGDVDNDALNALHAEGFGGPVGVVDWRGRLARHSLGWVWPLYGPVRGSEPSNEWEAEAGRPRTSARSV